MSETIESITDSEKLDMVWEWSDSPEANTLLVGQLKEYGGGKLPIFAVISEDDSYGRFRESRVQLEISYLARGRSSVVERSAIEVAKSDEVIEDEIREEFGEGEKAESFIEDQKAIKASQIKDGEMVESTVDAAEEMQHIAHSGEWYENITGSSQMEVA